MISLLFLKIAATALIVFLIMMIIDSSCNYQDTANGHYKTKVPAFVPYVGGTAAIVMVVSFMISAITAVWM